MNQVTYDYSSRPIHHLAGNLTESSKRVPWEAEATVSSRRRNVDKAEIPVGGGIIDRSQRCLSAKILGLLGIM
jgi:hypothetical protein